MLANLSTAANNYSASVSGERTPGQAIRDTAIDVGSGLFSGLGGIAAFGAGLANPAAGVAVAQGVQAGTDLLQGAQSPDLQERRDAFAGRNELNTRDNEQTFARDLPTEGGLNANLQFIGREAVNTMGSALSDPTVAASIIANAVGSFGAAGVVGKGIQVAGRAAPVIARNAGTLGIGATEAAGGYQQTASEVAGMSEEALRAGSQEYRDLRAQDFSHEEARTAVANRAGVLAAGLTAPAALAAGRLVNQFQMNPMRVPNLMGSLANIGKETLEEALQGGAGAVVQNAATNQVADSNRTLRQGVGEQIGLGALGGFGAAGTMQAPGTAARVLSAAARGAAGVAVGAIDRIGERADAVRAANDAASPVSNDNARSAVQEAVAQVQTPEAEQAVRQAINEALDATPEVQAQGNAFVDQVKEALVYNHQDLVNFGAPASVLAAAETATDKIDLVGRLSNLIETGETQGVPKEDILYAAQVMTLVQDGVASMGVIRPELADGTPGKDLVDRFVNASVLSQKSPGYIKAMRQAEQALTQAQEKGELTQDVTPASLETAEGQRAAQVAAAAAIVSPEGANLKTVTQMLAHSVGDAPKLRITPAQRNSLLAVKALLDAEQKTIEEQARLGHNKQIGRISKEILYSDKKGTKVSALSQAQAIVNAFRAGDVTGAKRELRTLGFLVRHMQNKVKAYNQHFEQGGGPNVPYQALSLYNKRPGVGAWYTNKAGHGVHPTNPKSIEQAQLTALEAQRLVEIYNGLIDGFPDLGAKKATPVFLDPRLDGKPEAVAAEFKAGKRTNGAKPKASETTEESAAPKSEPKKDVPAETTANKPAASTVSDEEAAAIDKAEQEAILAENAEADARFAREDAEKAAKSEPKAEEEPKISIDTAFPDLLGSAEGSKIVNQFKKVFKLPKEQLSRVAGVKSPLAVILQALSSPESLAKFLAKFLDGKGNRRKLTKETAEAYQAHLKDASKLLRTMEKNFQAFLQKRFKGDLSKLEADPRFTSYYNMKVLNVADQVGDGLKLNQELMEAAVLAGMQWLLTGQQTGSGWMDNEALSEMLGLPEDQVAGLGGVTNWLNTTVGAADATRQLADKISSYWGVRGVSSADDALVKGIPEAVAKELIRAMVENDMITLSTVTMVVVENSDPTVAKKDSTQLVSMLIEQEVNGETSEVLNTRAELAAAQKLIGAKTTSYPRFTFPALVEEGQNPKENPLSQDLSLIERVVLTTPKDVTFFPALGDKPPVATHQMNNPMVPNTPDDRAQIKAHSEVEFKPNLPMVELFTAIDEMGAVELFGFGDLAGRKLNKNHEMSMKGKNLSIQSAHIQLMTMMEEIRNVAASLGKDVAEIGVNYAFNVSKVGRLQMLGRFTPQASKYMREALTSTWSTLDLVSNPDHIRGFQLALGQALGVKVHQMPYAAASDKTEQVLESLAPVVELFQSFLETKKLPVSAVVQIKDGFAAAKVELTPVALHAVMEFARRANMEENEAGLKEFRTSLSLEADGVTNGVINAINLMTTGEFTGPQLKNMAKGGRFLIVNGPSTMNEQRGVDGADMYKEGQEAFSKLLKEVRDGLVAGTKSSEKKEVFRAKAVLEVFDQMAILLEMMFPKGDITFDESTQELVIGRGVMKNPMTISIYGSGNAGIAEKLVGVIADTIYERMSNVTERQAALPGSDFRTSFFANLTESDEEAGRLFDRFFKAFDKLTNTVVNNGKNGMWTKDVPQPKSKLGPDQFTLSRGQLTNMKQNILLLFVDPMARAIRQALGESVFESGKLIINATQAQSVFLEAAYERAKEAKLAELKAKDPTRTADSYLSADEQRELLASLEYLAPLIRTQHQTFFPAGTIKAEAKDLKFSTDLSERQSTPAYSYGPGQAGVAAMPGLNIGFGDGRAIQAALLTGHFKRSLAIFDGVHGPLDTIDEDSRILNEAIHTSWQGNPLQALHESYSAFLKSAEKEPMTDKMREILSRTFRMPGEDAVLDEATIRERMGWLEQDLLEGYLSVEARHMALSEVSQKVDQMAAAGAPFVKTGEDLKGTTHEEIAAELNASYQKHFAALTKKAGITVEAAPVPLKEVTPKKRGLGKIDKATGVRVISGLALMKAFRGGMPEIFDLIRRTKGTNGWTVVHGTPEQLQAWSNAKGLSLPVFGPGTKGLTSPSEKVIYLATPSLEGADLETMVHEVIHAATFEKVLEISKQLNDPNAGPASEEGKAVLRLRELMSQFLNLESQRGTMTPATWKAYRDAVAAIRGHLQNTENDLSTRQALALNEFMAWSLSNKDLSIKLKKTAANPFVQLAKDAIALIKKLILGRTVVSPPGESMWSNINFNTAIIVRSQPTVLGNLSKLTLAHQTSPSVDPRLTSVLETFTRVVGTHLNQNPVDDLINRQAMSNAVNQAVEYARDVRKAGFSSMTPQAAATFEIMVATLATKAEIDPSAMAKAQELFVHVTKDLTPKDLMSDPNSSDPNVLARAEAQWDILVGKQKTKLDRQGRSALLPIFLALATVDDGFRAFLAKKALPKAYKNEDRTLDALVENSASTLMSKLSDVMAGTTKAKNVQEAIDALSNQIQKTSMEHQSLLDYVVTPAGSLTDKANQKVTDMLQGAAAALVDAAERLDAKGSNKATKLVASVARLTEAAVNETKANAVGESAVKGVYGSAMWEPIKKLVADLVGRTLNNADIFDMIKQVRSMVSQSRQRYREDLPRIISEKFKRKLSEGEWSDLFHGMAENDLAALALSMKHDEIFELFSNDQLLTKTTRDLEKALQAKAGREWKLMQQKAAQLADFIKTKEPGHFLLKNAAAIASLAGLNGGRAPAVSKDAAFVADLDKLITLYTIGNLEKRVRETVSSLAQTDKDGLSFTLAFLEGQRKEEMERVSNSSRAQMNYYKGYIPSLPENGVSLIVSDDENYSDLVEKSYKRIGDYVGSSADYAGPNASKRGYYLAQTSARSPYNQGILQNVNQTASGVEAETGFTDGPVAGRIRSTKSVQAITKRLLGSGERAPNNESLMPVFNSMGRVVAYERALDPAISARVKKDTHLAKMIGVWRGRQVEEGIATRVNMALVDNTHKQYRDDMLASATNASQYVNIFDAKVLDADPVLKDAVELMPEDIRAYAQSKFGKDTFFVRKDLLDDTLGYRNASIGDAWNGTTRWDSKVQETVKKLALSMWGNEAYQRFVNAESILQGVVKDLKVLIVVKSVVVPVANSLSNMHHLLMRGVSPLDIARGMPRKLTEIQSYVTNRVRDIELEAELRAAESSLNTVQANKIRAERRSIADANSRMSIWPLIQAGEFSAISDAGISRDEILLTSGKLNEYIESKLSTLPGPFETMARYGMITRDTALFQGLQKAVDYGDFIAKAILFDSLTKKKGKTQKEALAQITEEFVNYDRLPGRFRGTLEDMGLLWFYNFKIRSVKVALSVLRNNPVHALLANSLLPDPGSVLGDNLISKGLAGGLPYSIGPGMGVRALGLNPWANLVF